MAKQDGLRKKYRREDLGGSAWQVRKGMNLMILSPDVAAVFPTEEAVNEALRSRIKVARRTAK